MMVRRLGVLGVTIAALAAPAAARADAAAVAFGAPESAYVYYDGIGGMIGDSAGNVDMVLDNNTPIVIQRGPGSADWSDPLSLDPHIPNAGINQVPSLPNSRIAGNPQGAAIIPWTDGQELRASYRPPGGNFGGAETIANYPQGVSIASIHVAMRSDNTAILAVSEHQTNPARYAVVVRTRSAKGHWSKPVTVDRQSGADGDHAVLAEDIATGPHNQTLLLIGEQKSARLEDGIIERTAYQANSGKWKLDKPLGTIREVYPRIAMRGDGKAIALMATGRVSDTTAKKMYGYTRTKGKNGKWSKPTLLSAPGSSIDLPDLGAAKSTALTAWRETSADGIAGIGIADVGADGAWTIRPRVTIPNAQLRWPSVLTDDNGRSAIAFTRVDPNDASVWAISRSQPGDFSQPGQLVGSGSYITGSNAHTIAAGKFVFAAAADARLVPTTVAVVEPGP